MSKASRLILILGILVIGFVALFMMWRGELEDQENLKKELALVQKILAGTQLPKVSELEKEIEAAEAEFRAAEAQFPKLDQNLEIADSLFKLAKQSNLEVVNMSTDVTKKTIDKIDYQVIDIELKVEGQLGDILSFIAKLGTELPAAEITSVQLQKAKTVQELDTGGVGVQIYTRRTS